ncbi:methylaspartate mutase accessory protein GlmL [Peptoniphilus catoniae]|uniref:methylaspartate mutase accessory protein GlmL n=1 Tax=Peptoniphilus catoniae TaxID=1660341 RepID=UPI0010FE7494|nr:methylaspartate mutase accessory protein GlmL [Peptoniphilus catoniae]
MRILLVDFGSTYTKLTLVDMDKEEIIARSSAITTVEKDVRIGYDEAYKKMKEDLGEDPKPDRVLACSSAAGGLKMIAIGLTKNLTAEAAKRSALGAGARILKTYYYELPEKDLEEIKNSPCDIILFSGGTEHGNRINVINNAKSLATIGLKIPVVVAVNSDALEEVEKIFKEANMNYYVTENVMPAVNILNAESARETIRKIFMDRIVKAKGMNNVEDEIDGILMPTPQAVIKAAQALSLGTEKEKGIGDLMVVDIGGATTDVHSIGYGHPTDNTVIYEGLLEPLAKRTVEGDLGMRYSALSLYEASGDEEISRFLPSRQNILEGIKKRVGDIKFVPKTQRDFEFDAAMASVATQHAVNRHVGVLTRRFTKTRYVYYQTGKDLTNLKNVIGTGGVLVHAKKPVKILSSLINNDPETLNPKDPEYFIDKDYILSAMGLLSMEYPDVAIRIMKKDLREVN